MSKDPQVDVEHRHDRLIIQDSESSALLLRPIIGYAQEPLLPLADACEPLIPIVHDIHTYISRALEHTANEPADGLTCDESAAIRLYTMEWDNADDSLYSILNHTLQTADRDDLRPWFKYLKLFLTAIIKLPTIPPQTVWCGMPKHMSNKFKRGADVIWWSILLTTTSSPTLENDLYLESKDQKTLLSIEIFNGRNIRNHSHFNSAKEILLLPGTYMEVVSQFYPVPYLDIIHLKQKMPQEILLELPFKGILSISTICFELKCIYFQVLVCIQQLSNSHFPFVLLYLT